MCIHFSYVVSWYATHLFSILFFTLHLFVYVSSVYFFLESSYLCVFILNELGLFKLFTFSGVITGGGRCLEEGSLGERAAYPSMSDTKALSWDQGGEP